MFPLCFFIRSLFSLSLSLPHTLIPSFCYCYKQSKKIEFLFMLWTFHSSVRCVYMSIRFVASGFLLQCHLIWLFDLGPGVSFVVVVVCLPHCVCDWTKHVCTIRFSHSLFTIRLVVEIAFVWSSNSLNKQNLGFFLYSISKRDCFWCAESFVL